MITASVRGETVTVLGPRPANWTGLGASEPDPAMLVEYPEGEIGAVRQSALGEQLNDDAENSAALDLASQHRRAHDPARPTPSESYLFDVLQLYEQADNYDALFWRSDGPEGLRFYALCNDVFAWAYADAETIEPEDLPLLRQCLSDLQAADETTGDAHLSELFAARKRQLRPQPAMYRHLPQAVANLFDNAGPERGDAQHQQECR
jgi:hypothetical protein